VAVPHSGPALIYGNTYPRGGLEVRITDLDSESLAAIIKERFDVVTYGLKISITSRLEQYEQLEAKSVNLLFSVTQRLSPRQVVLSGIWLPGKIG
jgi:hypothetical protein